jgi:hypothetical protein
MNFGQFILWSMIVGFVGASINLVLALAKLYRKRNPLQSQQAKTQKAEH